MLDVEQGLHGRLTPVRTRKHHGEGIVHDVGGHESRANRTAS